MNRKLRIGVIGGGIGGAALLAALQQRGMEAHLFERTAAFKEVGAGVQISPNAVKVLKALGLQRALRQFGFLPQAIIGRHWRSGRISFRTPLAEADACPRLFGAEYYHFHRADLLAMLVGLIDPQHVTLNAHCISVSNQGQTAVASFDNHQQFEADIIVGADGIHSVVRENLFGAEAPLFTGNMCWRAVIPTDADADSSYPESAIWQGPNGHVVTYAISDGKALNIVAVSETARWVAESWQLPSSRNELLHAFHGWHPDMIRILSQANNVFKWGLFDRQPMEHWSKGPITLLGDAAHPMLPFLAQGAAMAIEDGYILASLLATPHMDLLEALRLYELERAPRTGRAQLSARARGKRLHLTSPWQQFKRDFGYKLKTTLNRQSAAAEMGWIFSYDPTAFRPVRRALSPTPSAIAPVSG